jgi:hypothetical protein
MSTRDPELDIAAAAMVTVEARFVVVGGFSVIANRFVRATEDIDFLVPDDADNDRRVLAALTNLDGTRLRDDEPLREEHLIDQAHLRASTSAGIRPRDRNDLLGLAEIHGELPNEPIPGVDS